MQYDVKATKPLTSTGDFKDQNNSTVYRSRIKGVYAVCGASAGSVVLSDTSTGETLLTVNTPTVANAGSVYMLVPGEGILVQTSLYGTVTNTSSIVVFYG
jgi:hypothetical protein